jgi:hypothetical protein
MCCSPACPWPCSSATDPNSVDGLDVAELQRLVDDNPGMDLPNGRVVDTSSADWRALLHYLYEGPWRVSWPHAADQATRPSSADEAVHEDFSIGRVDLAAGVRVNVFPSWGTEHFWFDFSLRELRNQAAVDTLVEFLRGLGRAGGPLVMLSYEGDDDLVFAVYDADSDAFTWSPLP